MRLSCILPRTELVLEGVNVSGHEALVSGDEGKKSGKAAGQRTERSAYRILERAAVMDFFDWVG